MKKYLFISILAIAGFKSNAQSIDLLKKDMYGIASDATEGRFTASPGYLKAAKYVEGQLKAAGIKPGWTKGRKKAYLQPVPFRWDDYSGSSLIIRGEKYMHSATNFIIAQPGMVGRGKWIVLSPGDSLKQKAAGVIMLPAAEQAKDWETTVIREYRFGYMHYLPDGDQPHTAIPVIIASPALAKILVPGDSVTVELKLRTENKTGYNVIGRLPGTDPQFKHQAIIVGAHLDHIGRIGNHVYNGANDDASGCVAELGACRMLRMWPAKHPVIFAFFCGEELNLKGSHWFADHPPVPQKDILMSINLEQLGSKHRSFSGIWALGDPVFKTIFFKAGGNFTAQNLQFSATDSIRDVLSNTDACSFMNKNIPSLLLGSGGFNEHHTPQDKISLIDFDHLKRAAKLLYNLIKLTGKQNHPRLP